MIGGRLDFLTRMAGHQGAISLVAASLRFNSLAVLGFLAPLPRRPPSNGTPG